MKIVLSVAVFALAGLGLAGCATMEDDLAERGVAPLSGDEVEGVFSDATMQTVTPNWSATVYYAPDGRMTGRTTWDGGSEVATGTWEVGESGRMCRQWNNDWGAGDYGCFDVYRDGDSFIQVQKTGATGDITEFEVSRTPGNPRGL